MRPPGVAWRRPASPLRFALVGLLLLCLAALLTRLLLPVVPPLVALVLAPGGISAAQPHCRDSLASLFGQAGPSQPHIRIRAGTFLTASHPHSARHVPYSLTSLFAQARPFNAKESLDVGCAGLP